MLPPAKNSSSARSQMTYQQVRAWSVLPPETLAVFEQLTARNVRAGACAGRGVRGPCDSAGRRPAHAYAHRGGPDAAGWSRSGRRCRCWKSAPAQAISLPAWQCSARTVHSLEIRPAFAHRARAQSQGGRHRQCRGRGGRCFPVAAGGAGCTTWWSSPARCPCTTRASKSLLRPGGRLFVVSGSPPVMEARLVRLTAAGVREQAACSRRCSTRCASRGDPDGFVF